MRDELGLGLVMFLAACEPPRELAECDNVVDPERSFPSPGARSVHVGSVPYVTLAEPDASATLTLSDDRRSVLPGAVVVEGPRLDYVPARPMAPDTDHTLTLSYACGDMAMPFRTSSFGEELEGDPSRLVYELDFVGAQWLSPSGNPGVLGQMIMGDLQIWVSPTTWARGAQLRVGYGDGETQDRCAPTTLMDVDEVSGPFLAASAEVLPFRHLDIEGALEHVTIEAVFAADGLAFAGALRAQLDARPFDGLVGGAEGELCRRAATDGVPCVPCRDTGEPFCFDVHLEPIEAEWVDATLVDVAEPDPECSE